MSGALQQRKHQSLTLNYSDLKTKKANNNKKKPNQMNMEMAGEEGEKKPERHKAATLPSVL